MIENDLICSKYDIPLFFINKEKKTFDMLIFPEISSKKYQCSKDYLHKIKEILNLPNDMKKT